MRLFLFAFLLFTAPLVHASEDSIFRGDFESTDAKVTLDCDAKIEGATCPNPKKAGDCKRLLDSCGDIQQQSTEKGATENTK